MSIATRELTVLTERILNKSLQDLMQEIKEDLEWETRVFAIDMRMMTLKTRELFS